MVAIRPLTRVHTARNVRVFSSVPRIPPTGGEYSESFIEWSFSRDTRVDVDTMNEKLRSVGATRLRYSLRPDEAFGVILDLDEVLLDTKELMKCAWKALAAEEGRTWPAVERPQIYSVRPERAIMDILQWTRDFKAARNIAYRLACLYSEGFQGVTDAPPGVATWLEILSKNNIPLACVSAIDRPTMNSALERMGLRKYFRVLTSLDDGYENQSQLLLAAAWSLERAPNQTCFVAGSPSGITAAHNVTMKAIAVQGRHRAFELRGADVKCSQLDELAVYNIRRLFANRGSELMDLQLQKSGIPPPRRRFITGTLDPDDDPSEGGRSGGGRGHGGRSRRGPRGDV